MLELYHSAGGVLEALLIPPHAPESPTSRIDCNIRYSAHTSLAASSDNITYDSHASTVFSTFFSIGIQIQPVLV